MMKNDSLKILLNKYKFSNDIPVQVQKHIFKSKKRALFAIYRNKKKLSVLVVFVINLFFLIKRFGISLTFAKTYIVAIASTAVAFGILTSGASIYIYKNFVIEAPVYDDVLLLEEHKLLGVEKIVEKIKIAKSEKLVFQHKLTIIPFETENSESHIAKNIVRDIKKYLESIKGKPVIAIKSDISEAKTSKLLIGVLIKLEETYRISVKIIDKETTAVHFYDVEQVRSEKEIPDACRRIAKKISKRF